MSQVYYNEFDPFAAAWLRELIAGGHLPAGDVDTRSIEDVQPADLVGYAQCHFFAGIGGWPLALALAGWPADRPVWTGSCPCQPYSSAGKQEGDADPRNLWPHLFRLVRERRPECVLGEQVEGAVRHGWLDRVSADLEGEGYAVGAVVLGAHSVGAPHIRQRLYWVGHASGAGPQGHGPERELREGGRPGEAGGAGGAGGVGHADRPRKGAVGGVPGGPAVERQGGAGGFWDAYDLIPCRDGKSRRVEPGTFPLAHGVPNRVGLLRGYGNAIVPQVAAEFVRAFLSL